MTARSSLRRLLAQLWREHSSPRRLGLALALGVFIGCTPLYGLHSVIGVALALLLRLNKPAVLLGTQISMPPVVPFLTFASVQVGSLLLSGRPLPIAVTDLHRRELYRLLGRFAAAWAVGGVMVGAALGAVGYLVTATIARRRRARAIRP